MMDKNNNEWPNVGDFVVCTVKNVTDFGAYVTLDEYGDKEGFIHISEIKAGWVKYVRDYVREGQKIVCKVLKVDPNRRHIDLSLKDVNEHQKREKIQQWKNEQKASKWLQFVAEETGTDEKTLSNLKSIFTDEFGSPYAAFEEAAMYGEDAFENIKIDKSLEEKITKIAQDNIKIPYVEIAGYVDLTSNAPDGIENIKQALNDADSTKENYSSNVKIDISYTGAPRYRIKVNAPDYKTAENALKNAAETATNTIRNLGGKGEFYRHIEATSA
ncbi:translation initiation factor 2, alpha subunit [Methanohalobium evestigatum Z-7303]|uniref:Translation initiation factor 2 subunit alpha n=1 Tax=Methanohalobium evestigatum (strain ATCC BAA-1072 / DSM 3721 / NBRC 107634 / OCM 161 / Z-7303) TaxID=644295 RepID=D7EBG9_METEZ|nr:translation initiation factor IF-2 subunit alpha [Methanohalobium evestigatum]ADI74811.1 translation initiation factor 2, alpha subunit [Methanohalobium evestigatum Z-7303]